MDGNFAKTYMTRLAAILSIFCFLSFFMIAAVSAGITNSKWIYIAGTKSDQGFSYDRESIVQISNNMAHVWTKRLGRYSSEIKVLVEVDCANKIMRDAQLIVEKPSAAASSLNRDRSWRGVVRGTPEGELFSIICRKPAPESFKKQ